MSLLVILLALSCSGSSGGDPQSGATAASPGTALAYQTPPITEVGETPSIDDFVGQLNGISFETGQVIPEIIQCPTESLRALPVPDVSAAVQNSDIAFDVTYVPAGFSLGIETATACGDNVVRITRAYVRNGPASQVPISITRIEREPVVGALAPIGRMEAMTIGGHPSVLVHPADNAAPTEIVMRDDVSVWLVSSNLDTAEVIKIAARLK